MIGDVNTHEAKSYGQVRMPGVNLANNVPDIQDWVNVVQAFESKQSRNFDELEPVDLAYLDPPYNQAAKPRRGD